MKNFVVIFLLCIYGFSSPGMTLHLHYCCGKIDKVDIEPVKKHDCDAPKHMATKGCCDNKQVDLKIKDDYQKDAELKSLDKPATERDFNYIRFQIPVLAQDVVTGFTDSSPPFYNSSAIRQLYCIYRI